MLSSVASCVISVVVLGTLTGATRQHARPFTTDDLLRLESVDDAVFSPDGSRVAYVVIRERTATPAGMSGSFLGTLPRSETWVATLDGRRRRIAGSGRTGTGEGAPVWSPDGCRLAVLSLRGGVPRIWVYDTRRGTFRRVSQYGTVYSGSGAADVVWVSDHELLYPAVPDSIAVQQLGVLQSTVVATRGWADRRSGNIVTASVLTSGPVAQPPEPPTGRLLLVDVETGQTRVVLEGQFSDLQLSPGRRYVTMVQRTGDVTPVEGRSLRSLLTHRYRAVVVSGRGVATFVGSDSINVLPASFRWAPNGARLAYIGLTSDFRGDARRAYAIDTVLWRARPVTPAGTDVAITGYEFRPADVGLVWLNADSLANRVVDTPPFQASSWDSREASLARYRWTWFDNNARPIPLVDTTRLVALSRRLAPSEPDLPKPEPGAELLAMSSASGAGVFRAVTRTGTRLWLVRPGRRPIELLSANTFLASVAEAPVRIFQYTSLHGELLTAQLMLPAEYKPDHRYPVVVYVYLGYKQTAVPYLLTQLTESHPINLQLLAAHGYAVLLPSMPMSDSEAADDERYPSLPIGVFPALDSVIAMGVGDSARVAVFGHSFGGFSTYGLITQTHRFRAAVSMAGMSDFASLYGTFDPPERYGQTPHYNLWHPAVSEDPAGWNLRTPPWADVDRYVRNSPLTFVGNVETPILIIYGDLDYINMEQGEEFFSALYRRGKPAEFVRYWGEGHVVESPANIRDMWARIYRWLDRYLR